MQTTVIGSWFVQNESDSAPIIGPWFLTNRAGTIVL